MDEYGKEIATNETRTVTMASGEKSEVVMVASGNETEAVMVASGNETETVNVTSSNETEAVMVASGNETGATLASGDETQTVKVASGNETEAVMVASDNETETVIVASGNEIEVVTLAVSIETNAVMAEGDNKPEAVKAKDGEKSLDQLLEPMILRRDILHKSHQHLTEPGDKRKTRILRMETNLTKEIEKIKKKGRSAFRSEWKLDYPVYFLKPRRSQSSGPSEEPEGGQPKTGNHVDVVDAGSSTRGQSRSGSVSVQTEICRSSLRFICKAVPEKADSPHIKHARVLFLVNVEFDNKSNRHEALEDYRRLHAVFIEKLGYDDFMSVALRNKSKYGLSESRLFDGISNPQVGEYSWRRDQMLEIIKSFVQAEYLGNALILFVNSHGNRKNDRDVVYGMDCRPVYIDEILEIFEKHSHPSVKKVPKFVFIQACRGERDVPLSTISVVGNGNIGGPSNQDVVHDPLSGMDMLTLDEESFRTQGIGYQESSNSNEPQPPATTASAMSQSVDSIHATSERGQTPSVITHHNTTCFSPATPHLDQSQGAIPKNPSQLAAFRPQASRSQRDRGLQTATSNPPTQPDTTISVPMKSCDSLPNIPKNFLIVFSTPKDCVSGRIPTENHDPIIDEGCIFSQIFALHLEACLAQVGASGQGVALLPLLTGVQNEISIQWLEIGVISHTLTEQPVLNKNKEIKAKTTDRSQ